MAPELIGCWIALMCVYAQGQTPFPTPLPFASPSSCALSQYFQAGNLSCVECGHKEVPTGDGLSCQCEPGYIREGGRKSSPLRCMPCPPMHVSTRDGLFCLSCDLPTSFNPATQSCTSASCGPSTTGVYKDSLPANSSSSGSRLCATCPQGTWSGGQGLHCVECGIHDCTLCSAEYGGICFEASQSLSLAPPAAFSYYQTHFTAAAALCQEGNYSACQLLANLCVLQQYAPLDPACQQARTISNDLLPPIYYAEMGADELLALADVQTRLVARGTAGSPVLPLVVTMFDLSGAFLGMVEVTDEILLCRDLPSHTEAAWMAGVDYSLKCMLDPQELSTAGKTPTFYDLFLRDQGEGVDRLYPVPVLVEDYVNAAGQSVNTGSDPSKWQFVRRFFLQESVSNLHVYARAMLLHVKLNSNGKIFPPFLGIKYSPLLESEAALSSSFSVQYTQQSSTAFIVVLSATVGVTLILAVVYTAFRVNGYLRRSGGFICHPKTFLCMITEFCSFISTCVFIVLTVVSVLMLLLYKFQSVFIFTLPTGASVILFSVMICLAFICRAMQVIYLVWQQCTLDIFFVDWEKPNGVVMTTALQQEPSAQLQSVPTPVSIWRVCFAANEWNELQTVRKLNPTLLLSIVLLLLSIVGLEHFAEVDPSSLHVTTSQDRYSAAHSIILRFALTSICFLSLSAIMRLYMFGLYERFYEHKIKQFVDLCSVANVSVFVLSEELFGHYIHGRSVHGRADTDMQEMRSNLIKEQEDICGKRGLLADSDGQTFAVGLTKRFRAHYEAIMAPIQAERVEGHTRGSRAGAGPSDRSIQAYKSMNHFLCAFIDRGLQDLDYLVKDKLFLEKLLEMEFYDPLDRSLFYSNTGNSFEEVLFYGNEWALWQLDVLLFACVDLLSNSYVLAAVITYLSSWVLYFLRDLLGKRNIARKTLIDERFLV